MSHASPGPGRGASRRRALAADILGKEGLREDPAGALASVLGSLDDLLRPMIGTGGFGAILGRATVVAAQAHPGLGKLPLSGNRVPSPESLTELLGDLEETREAGTALLAELLTFMGRLIGWRLTLVLLGEPWPDVADGYSADELDRPTDSDSDSDSEKGEGHAAD